MSASGVDSGGQGGRNAFVIVNGLRSEISIHYLGLMVNARSTGLARSVGDSAGLRFAARFGFFASGVIHLLIGLIAIQIAFHGSGAEADQSGAFGQVASTPGGVILLWILVVGLAALGVWLIVHAFLTLTRHGRRRGANFAADFARGVVYLVLAFTAFDFASGRTMSSDQSTSSISGRVLAAPGGSWLLALIGVAVFAVGIYLLVKGLTRRFKRDLTMPTGSVGRATVVLGVCGYAAKAIALCSVGVLFVVAALSGDAAKANGLDGALKTLASLPFGVVILVTVGVGFIAYGAYSFVRTRFARL